MNLFSRQMASQGLLMVLLAASGLAVFLLGSLEVQSRTIDAGGMEPALTPTPTPTVFESHTPTPTATPIIPATPGNTIGDVNKNGVVNVIDAQLILQARAGYITLANPKNADANASGQIDAVDAAIIDQFVAGMIDQLPPAPSAPKNEPAESVFAIESLSLEPGRQGTVRIEVETTSPGLGAWEIDVMYPEFVSAVDCSAYQGGVCNENFGDNTVRVAGANAGGLTGVHLLLEIYFECGTDLGTGLLALSIKIAADATVGGPQAIQELDIQDEELECFISPTPTPEEVVDLPDCCGGNPCGDVNLDGARDSVDATLILQFTAGLISSLRYEAYGDVNQDGLVNSVDAALILQMEAGLVLKLRIPTPTLAGMEESSCTGTVLVRPPVT